MVLSTRTLMVTGLGLAGLGLLTGRLLGQGPQDNAVRQTNTASAAAPTVKVTNPPVVGTIDMERVLKEYEKFAFLGQEFQASVLAKKNELMKLGQDMQQNMEAMQKFRPGTPEVKKFEDQITFLKAQMEAKKEQAQHEFELKEAESLATLYKEIQEMAGRVAQLRKMTYILKVSNQSVSGGDPKSVMAAMSSTVIYSDRNNDISDLVVYHLNKLYRANGGQPAKTNATARATTQPAGGGAPAAADTAVTPARGPQR